MSTDTVRFVHASDLHLERTLGGLVSVPTWLRDDFIDAPFKAAENVFDVALKESVDFVVLSGDVLDVETAGPRAIDFLLQQFNRLLEGNIEVYWSGGSVDDPDLWPAEIALPKNVHVFPTGRPQTFEYRRKKRIVAAIVGQSCLTADQTRASEFSVSQSQGAKIAVAHGTFEKRALQKQSIDYWALGGEHNEETLYQEQSAARYSGSPQGFTPDEIGQHGCSVVTIEHGRVSCRNVPTQVIRWQREPIQLAADANRKDLEQSIRNQLNSLRNSRKGDLTLVTWSVSCNGALASELRNDTTCSSILSAITQLDGESDNQVVSVAIENQPRQIPDGQFEEESIMGDFLRTVREFENDPNRIIDLAEYLPETTVRHEVVSALTMSSPTERKAILRRVAALGMDLLSGDSKHLDAKS
jgi:DNA repair exonuclease SbcCD nuclease subunit